MLKGIGAPETVSAFPGTHIDALTDRASTAASTTTAAARVKISTPADGDEEGEGGQGESTGTTATTAAAAAAVASGRFVRPADVLSIQAPAACPTVVLAAMASCHSLVLQVSGRGAGILTSLLVACMHGGCRFPRDGNA